MVGPAPAIYEGLGMGSAPDYFIPKGGMLQLTRYTAAGFVVKTPAAPLRTHEAVYGGRLAGRVGLEMMFCPLPVGGGSDLPASAACSGRSSRDRFPSPDVTF